MNQYTYFSNCINWEKNDVPALIELINNSIEITRKTFLKHVNRIHLSDLEKSFGYEHHYSQGLIMARDYHVSYHRGKLHNNTAYFFKQSAIEYVFIK